jgi:hypothetical protein
MIIKVISGTLLLFTAFMGIKHGWQGLTAKPGDTGPAAELFRRLDLSPLATKGIGLVSILSALLILVPQTFVIGNVLNAALILILMILFLNAREIKPALIEVPFLLIPLLLIYFKHPLVAK